MLFTGTSEHSIDAKLRLAVPAKYRNQWNAVRDGAAWFCVPWPTARHLRLYTEGAFAKMAEQLPASLAPPTPLAEFDASFFGYAERLELDSAGRLMIPKLHMQLTGLSSDVVIVGARTHLEVRDREAWMKGLATRFDALPSLAAQIDRAGGGGVEGNGGARDTGAGGASATHRAAADPDHSAAARESKRKS